MLTFMDEFRTPSRPVRSEGNTFDVPMRTGITQTPNQIAPNPAPSIPTAPSSAAPTVNASLLGGYSAASSFTPPAPVTPVQPIQPAQPVAQPVQTFAPSLNIQRDFTMPRPQTICQEVAVVSASAQAANAVEPEPAAPFALHAAPVTQVEPVVAAPTILDDDAQPQPSPFDIATIEEEAKPKNRLRTSRNWKKWAIGGGVGVLSLLLGTGGLLFAQGYSNANKVFRGSGSAAAASVTADNTTLKGEDTGRVNILMLGNGGLGHDAPDLTDTIIVASIDTKNKTASMLSIPRDLWVQVPDSGATKLNAAYEIGKYNAAGKIDNTNTNTKAVLAGFDTADQAVEKVLGIDIHYNVLVNFKSFKQAVDSVDGVTVDVPEALYDPTMAWENGGNPTLAAVGTQKMDGTKALQYVRSRQTSSDFARSQRQRSVILSLVSKATSAGTLSNPLKVSGLLNAFGDNLVTDMSLPEGMRAYDLIKGIDKSKVQTVDLVTPPNNLLTTGSIQGASIAYPRAGMFSYADVQKYLQTLFNPPKVASATTGTAVSTAPETAAVSVLNGTTRAGLAGTQAAVIKGAGYPIGQTGNAPTQGYAKTVVVDLSSGANPKTKKYLETLYGVTAVAQLPDAAIQATAGTFVVILGSDQVR